MRITQRLGLTFALCGLISGGVNAAAPSLGGLRVSDSLDTLFKAMSTPDLIRARRMDSPQLDHVSMLYDRQGNVIIAISHYGDKVETVLAETKSMVTDDGLKVGDPRSLVVSKRGQPEELDDSDPQVAEYWYWSKGINFGINKKKDSIENVFIFPPSKSSNTMERVALPESQVTVTHGLIKNDRSAYVVGTATNKRAAPLYGVRVGITLRNKQNLPVDVVFSEIGGLLPNASMPFKVDLPLSSGWDSYSVSIQSSTSSEGISLPADPRAYYMDMKQSLSRDAAFHQKVDR
jgi:hypothetical protein